MRIPTKINEKKNTNKTRTQVDKGSNFMHKQFLSNKFAIYKQFILNTRTNQQAMKELNGTDTLLIYSMGVTHNFYYDTIFTLSLRSNRKNSP